MLSAADIFEEIRANDEAFRFFVSTAAKGEYQGGWENEQIAARTRDDELRPKIERHGFDESKHGRLFENLLKKRGLTLAEVPFEADYCAQLEKAGIGLSHERLRQETPLDSKDILAYLAHSRVTEQRAAEEVAQLERVFGDNPDIGPTIKMIADDEINHLSFCHEELLRLKSEGLADQVSEMLKVYALAEIKTYRRVSLAFIDRMSSVLGWSFPKRVLLKLGVQLIYFVERLLSWRRMVALREPVRPGVMAAPARTSSSA